MSSSQASEVIEHLRRTVLQSDRAGLTDGQLLEDFIRRQDEAALAALVRRHGPMVWGVCRRLLGGRHQDAEDAFQVSFLVLVRKAASVKPREMVANWLYGVAYQTALKARTTTAKRRVRERQVTVMPEPAVHDPDLWDDVQPLLDRELSQLPDKYRTAIVLCDLEGKSYKEAARQLGVPDGTLSARLTRARAMLAKRLAGRGLTVSGASLAAVLTQNAAPASAPASVVAYTIKAVSVFAAGEAVKVVISARAAALMEGVLMTMLFSKLKTVTALVLVLLTCVGGALAYLPRLGEQSESGKIVKRASSQEKARDAAVPLKANFPDLKKIDRTIVREPKYKNTPYYALLAIGPEAKKRFWLVVDGDVVYMDRNGNGDFTEPGERISLDVEETKKIKVGPGMYTGMNSFELGDVEGLKLRLDYWVRDRKFVPRSSFDKSIFKDHEEKGWEFSTLWRILPDGSKSAQIPLCFCRLPKDAQVCHLGGRLTFALRDGQRQSFVCTAAETTLSLMIGTPGLPARNWREPVFAPLSTNEVPASVHPLAHIEFPHKDTGQPPIKIEAALNKRC
jgi:RNA polymerase sigma factor (sigma-70 family)